MKSAWHLHIELEKKVRLMKKRREWWEEHGRIVRDCVYIGIGVVIAIILNIVLHIFL